MVPSIRVSRTLLFGSSSEGASRTGVRSASWLLLKSTSSLIFWAPELSTTSGGLPPLKRVWSFPVISWVPRWELVVPHFLSKAASQALA